ncbi:MAG TPA: thioredoxin domain-containing protein [Mycobacteriales bacterium]|nr:thioredoxin domain-containing protein [Mycobacteriales bacterium]
MSTAVRVLLGAVWAWAAVATLADVAASVRTLRVGRVLPDWLAPVIGYGLPVLELGLAVLLLLGLTSRLTEVIGSVLLVLFLADIVAAATDALRSSGPSHAGALLRDAGLLAVCVFSLWTDRRRAPVADRPGWAAPRTLDRLLGQHADWSRRSEERRLQRIAVLAGVALIAAVGTGLELRTALSTPEPATPPNASIADGVTLGRPDAPVRIDVWEDLLAPPCRRLDGQLDPLLSRWLDTGVARVHFHVIALLDVQSDYSSRAANALYAAANLDPVTFRAVRRALYSHQPRAGTPDPTDDDLVALAGVPALADAVHTSLYAGYVAHATDRAVHDGITGTPAVRVNGTPVSPDARSISAAVAAAIR